MMMSMVMTKLVVGVSGGDDDVNYVNDDGDGFVGCKIFERMH